MKQLYTRLIALSGIAVMLLLSFSCKKDPVIEDDPPGGKIKFTFSHLIDGQPASYDTTMYVNAAGNHYQVNEVQYFISDITLHKAGGSRINFTGNNEIYYVDKDIPSTLSWAVPESIPPGSYDSITFTFGISPAKNQSNMFVNKPEVDMWWPVHLGGGYHYLKLNMKWLDINNVLVGNAFHLGIGQILDINGNITGFVHNSFRVHLPNSAFTIIKDKTTCVPLIMNIENWFQTPNIYDFNVWGGDIMQNQAAMAAAAANGHDVFTTGIITN